jgi:DNA uptake protein ComE-like DNA-binding protein
MNPFFAAVFAVLLSFTATLYAATPSAPLQIAQATEKIDINTAKADELMTLKGVGEARAKAIIKGRPYARKDELVQRKIIPQSVYDEIKEQIIAKQK